MGAKRLEQLTFNGGVVIDMESKRVEVKLISINTLQWDGKGKFEDFVTEKAPKFIRVDGFAAGPFMRDGYIGVAYLQIVSRGKQTYLGRNTN